MSTGLTYEQIHSALADQPLFEAKSWQLSPDAWPLTPEQVTQLEAIGAACLEFHQALETLYLRSVAGKNLLRNKPLLAPWVADYLDRGKPAALVAHARDPRNRGAFPPVLRPDLLLTDDGFVLTELDSVPGGIGLTAFLNRLYAGDRSATSSATPASSASAATPGDADAGRILGADDGMIRHFYAALAALAPAATNPLIALVVSDEAATYRPEMQWLAHQLQLEGKRVFCLRPEDIFPLENALFFDADGNPEKIDVLYRFFELFDLENIRTQKFIFEAWAAGEVQIAPPMRHFQEEKLALALFHHHLLQDYWHEALSGRAHKLLRGLIPASWIMDPTPIPPGAVLDGPRAAGRPLTDWRDLAHASQKERDLIIKISGYHETAWGARSVVLGSDCSREEWQEGINRALGAAATNLHVLQAYRKPRRTEHPVYEDPVNAGAPAIATTKAGRLRLCPYYFTVDGQARLSGALATFCPPDKKIIHGMQDAALLPCTVLALKEARA
ncbi:hypothetical protein [Opitutus sp. ER46]|uniref:hypothetical protein n=1 Tax=Opitutus sp. ER46 TaxID=2161864 RepID=UPI000D308DE4|nr:hypothetical protein [Opitutus sp. ER46]PTX97694.1 hypothetical protein DB354_05280 [Opitutus sp. ER46]